MKGRRRTKAGSATKSTDSGDAAARTDRALFWLGLAVLLLAGLTCRLDSLQPASLFLDDLWVALLARDASLGQYVQLHPPIPLGFFLMLKGIALTFGAEAWKLQIVALVGWLGTVLGLGLVGRAITGNTWAGLVAAGIAAVNLTLGVQSFRLKQYSLESLIVTCQLGACVWYLQRPELRRLSAIVALGAAGLFISFVTLFFSFPLVHLALWHCWWTSRQDPPSTPQKGSRQKTLSAGVIGVLGYDILAAVMYFALARLQASPAITKSWEGFYLPWSNFSAVATYLAQVGSYSITGAFPFVQPSNGVGELPVGWQAWSGGAFLVVLMLIGWWSLVRDNRYWLIGWLSVALTLQMVIVSALKIYPLGGGRTDIFVYPLIFLLTAVGCQFVVTVTTKFFQRSRAEETGSQTRETRPSPATSLPLAQSLVVGGIVVLFSWLQFQSRVGYPTTNDAQAVHTLNDIVRPNDALLIYPWANYAAAYYGKWDSQLVAEPFNTNGFHAKLLRDHTLVLSEGEGDIDFLDSPAVTLHQLQSFVAEQKHRGTERLVYFVASYHRRVDDLIRDYLKSQGLEVVEIQRMGGVRIVVYRFRK